MNCPNCGGNTRVVYSTKGVDQVLRYRKCYGCRFRFKTIELEEPYARQMKKERNAHDR
ncbi:MAG: hypothetical protein IJ043_03160 [Clostridia bacterium]|nr:hypothetical protein [Clostridia bacterium]